ncbi:MAG: hypothetical protein B6244_06290 [Candidatus Cloacimonetes bacterium 4572_55]|nr:MAG: hypothetical protein B6244_06290 [Candidatus Cloacimonetes bacterium 4572_55]
MEHRISILFSNPLIMEDKKRVPTLNFEGEKENLESAFQEAGKQIDVCYAAAHINNLQNELAIGCQVLHYTGHGNKNFLAFEDGKGIAHLMKTDNLKRIIQSGKHSELKLAFVSACHSQESGMEFVKAGVPHVVAIKRDVGVLDNAAQIFARTFYYNLLIGRTVRDSFNNAIVRLKGDPDTAQIITKEADKFLLLPDDSDDPDNQLHDQPLFKNLRDGNWKDVSHPLADHYLPPRADDFTDRHLDMQELVQNTLQGRLTTVLGGPGIGKTTMTVAAGHYLLQRHVFEHGVWFIELRGVVSAENTRYEIGYELDIDTELMKDDRIFFKQLRKKEMLLILDNCEDPFYENKVKFRNFIKTLLQRAPTLKIIATSRQAFGGAMDGVREQIQRVRQLDALDGCDLLEKRAGAKLDINKEPNISYIIQRIVAQLSGHPRAIILASSQLETKTFAELNDDLSKDPLTELKAQGLEDEEHDATNSFAKGLDTSVHAVRNADPEAIRLFSLLGLLPAGAMPNDLDILWGKEWQKQMNRLIRASLVDKTKSLGMEKYETFSFVAAYAQKLLSDTDRPDFNLRCLNHFAEVCEEIHKMVYSDKADQGRRLLALTEANIWATMDPIRLKTINPKNQRAPLQSLASHFPMILNMFDRHEDNQRFLDIMLDHCNEIKDRLGQAHTLKALGDLKHRVHNLDGALHDYEQALSIYNEIKDRLGQAHTLRAFGDLKLRVHDLDGALHDYEQALSIYNEIKNRQGQAHTLKALGDLKLRVHDLDGALHDYKQALSIYNEIKHRLGQANTLKDLGDLKHRVADLDGALHDYKQALSIYNEIKDRLGQAHTLQALGDLKCRDDDLDGALHDYKQALSIFNEIKNRQGQAHTLHALGDLKCRDDDLDGALHDYKQALFIYKEIKDQQGQANTLQALGNFYRDRGEYERAIDYLNQALRIHESISDRFSAANDLFYLIRVKLAQKHFIEAVLLSEKTLKIYRDIKNPRGQALTLENQAKAFQGLQNPVGAVAANWQAWQIYPKPEAGRDAERFSKILEKDIGSEKFQGIMADLPEMSEAWRLDAVSNIQQESTDFAD